MILPNFIFCNNDLYLMLFMNLAYTVVRPVKIEILVVLLVVFI